MKQLLLTTIAAVLVVGCGNPEADRALLNAAREENIEAVKQHLAAGADVNVKDNNGCTPLHTATKEIAELLIANGADVNAKAVDGETPLDFANMGYEGEPPEDKVARKEIADLLRKHGGKTGDWLNADKSIHLAAREGNIEAVKQHLAAGTDVKRFDIQKLRQLAGKDKWKEYPGNPVLTRGKKDEWDGWAIGSMSVVKAAKTYHMYYEGWGQGTIQIGHAVSEDGVHWEKDPKNPVLPCSEKGWDSGGTWDAFVLYEDGLFKMWYGATPYQDAKGNFHWGYAVSKDGTHFEKKSRISGEVANAEFEDDHVVHDKNANRYYMYYWDRTKEPKGLYRVESINETDFDFTKAKPVKNVGLCKTPMHKFTHVFKENDEWYMYYAEFKRPRCHNCKTGYATSSNGLNWKVKNGSLLLAQDAEIIKVEENLYLMYYGPNGFFDGEGCDIRLALFAGNLDDLSGKN